MSGVMLDFINKSHDINYVEIVNKNNEFFDNIELKSENIILDEHKIIRHNVFQFIISRNCDMIGKVTLKVDLPALKSGSKWKSNLGDRIIKSIKLNIGGNEVENLKSDYLHLSKFLERNEQEDIMYNKLTGNTDLLNNNWESKPETTIFIPINFSLINFKKNKYLSLISLTYSQSIIEIEIEDIIDLIDTKSNNKELLSKELDITISFILKGFYCENPYRQTISNRRLDNFIDQVDYEDRLLRENIVLNRINGEVKYLLMYIKPNDKNFYDFNNMDLIESCQLNYNDLIRSTQSGDSLSILNFYEFFNKIPKNKYYLINFAHNKDNYSALQTSNFTNMSKIELKLKFNSKEIDRLIQKKKNKVLEILKNKLNDDIVSHLSKFLTYKCDEILSDYRFHTISVNINILVVLCGMCGLRFST